jgi:gliding motility-associated-like protein
LVSAGRDTTICIGSLVSLRATGNGTYLWAPANLVNNPVIADPLATPTITTLFTITLTDQFGCINSDEVRVTVLSSPEPDAGPDQVLEYSFNTTMAAKIPSVGETAAWSLLTGKGIIAEASNPNSRVNGLSVGENLFLWTINNGKCPPVSDTVKVAVRDLQVPSLITPNMDGKNDFLVLRGIEILGKTELVIFNRWGAQVYKNQNYDNSWDGTDMNGDPLPDDTYFYVLKTANGKSLSSFIVIQR